MRLHLFILWMANLPALSEAPEVLRYWHDTKASIENGEDSREVQRFILLLSDSLCLSCHFVCFFIIICVAPISVDENKKDYEVRRRC